MTQQNNSVSGKLAPIVLFVYNRPWHTRQTVEALQKNELANESKIFIYSDGPKNENAVEKVKEVQEYIKIIDKFREITIVEREKNWGLANNIVDGVNKIVNEYGKIIVLEDDLVTSSYFLKFMNEALEFYKDEEKVWHVNGWNNPIDANDIESIYFSRIAYSWAWGTWKDRWAKFNNDPEYYIRNFSKKDIWLFNINGTYDMWGQLIRNKKGTLKTWAVFWNAQVYISKGLCLNNTLKLVKCIGTDGSGENCGVENTYIRQELSCKENKYSFPTVISFHNEAQNRLIDFIKKSKKSFTKRLINKLRRFLNV